MIKFGRGAVDSELITLKEIMIFFINNCGSAHFGLYNCFTLVKIHMKRNLLFAFFSFVLIVSLVSPVPLHLGYMNNSASLSQPNFPLVQFTIQTSFQHTLLTLNNDLSFTTV